MSLLQNRLCGSQRNYANTRASQLWSQTNTLTILLIFTLGWLTGRSWEDRCAMVDIVGAEERILEEVESSSEPASTPNNKTPTDAALRISLILAGIVATVCILCLVFAAYSMHHNNDLVPSQPGRSSLLTQPRHR
ncbi:MAG: hypothetical protein P4L53_08255 [Candidatus Obscuribacterales bacterium]|nr:hypothetical protein [Candidatus Obscuribacterales bacterium]